MATSIGRIAGARQHYRCRIGRSGCGRGLHAPITALPMMQALVLDGHLYVPATGGVFERL